LYGHSDNIKSWTNLQYHIFVIKCSL